MADHEQSIRKYLSALADPTSLTDESAIAAAEKALESEDDPIERVRVRQHLIELRAPSLSSVEDEFVMHAKAWAEATGVTAEALAAEGVPSAVLRRAGFSVAGGRGRSRRSGSGGSGRSKRVTTEEVVASMPSGTFTVKMLQEASGASAGVVRKAIGQELEAGRLAEEGTDPDHSGPGRAPTLYRR